MNPTVALTEFHDIVYREAPSPDDVAPPPQGARRTDRRWSKRWAPDDVLLFRYSALTFNGHRIHYDRRYVTEVEGYPGLIVHGPLIATLLLDLLRRQRPDARRGASSSSAPCDRSSTSTRSASAATPQADGKSFRLWARDHEGWLRWTPTAVIE